MQMSQPISNVYIEIYKDGILVATGYTDANGQLELLLQSGTYKIRASKSGYETVEKTVVVEANTSVTIPMCKQKKLMFVKQSTKVPEYNKLVFVRQRTL